ncbi:MAG: Asp-tRNA(Asn)/Glu-tRNA(Gln) amidotransferase GatCAB subunit C [Gammaproteobacteria bacterium]|nr:MAG: Asp-tRNA(Asn)/Glu-tRNA(Gln) amidotransferase GatCAB subunit C [Gammaproteobacteria bacterium]RLA12826.1 MAG: Asp-tRNA(Asn)/Glu-tRNA(Gln) amidotransferase GatCAB subunit C [Gammaproteobacteria bacterium]RLA17642.1 MAG: Asp-tRNA(Asn)/Glu-tRNA(Gln) amidotransferase GatCAB subunit C [Gammaproteobacteria bacterium]
MSVSHSDVKQAAHLARIGLDPVQIDHHLQDLQQILKLVEQISAVDTDGIEPLSNPLDAIQRMREDLVTESDQHDKFQPLSAATQDSHYLVPKVIEQVTTE